MNQLPNDVNMLFSFVNMKLRDEYSSLNELCNALDIDQEWLTARLATAGFEYNQQQNKFWQSIKSLKNLHINQISNEKDCNHDPISFYSIGDDRGDET